jgi:hypothetical protein
MSLRVRVVAACVAAVFLSAACQSSGGSGGGLVRQYEYEEEIDLSLDGSASVHVNASVPALVNLRGLDLDTRPNARIDRAQVRKHYEAPGVEVLRVSTWRRLGRRFVQVRIRVDDIRVLGAATPFAWSSYELAERDGLVVYRQRLGAAAGRDVGQVGWKGNELTAVRLHLPARIRYHNAGKDNLRRGNILVWEQPFAARQSGTPLEIEARMDRQSILYSTLLLFAVSGGLALAVLALIIWWVMRKGHGRQAA